MLNLKPPLNFKSSTSGADWHIPDAITFVISELVEELWNKLNSLFAHSGFSRMMPCPAN
jgi:hypothetical protein